MCSFGFVFCCFASDFLIFNFLFITSHFIHVYEYEYMPYTIYGNKHNKHDFFLLLFIRNWYLIEFSLRLRTKTSTSMTCCGFTFSILFQRIEHYNKSRLSKFKKAFYLLAMVDIERERSDPFTFIKNDSSIVSGTSKIKKWQFQHCSNAYFHNETIASDLGLVTTIKTVNITIVFNSQLHFKAISLKRVTFFNVNYLEITSMCLDAIKSLKLKII